MTETRTDRSKGREKVSDVIGGFLVECRLASCLHHIHKVLMNKQPPKKLLDYFKWDEHLLLTFQVASFN